VLVVQVQSSLASKTWLTPKNPCRRLPPTFALPASLPKDAASPRRRPSKILPRLFCLLSLNARAQQTCFPAKEPIGVMRSISLDVVDDDYVHISDLYEDNTLNKRSLKDKMSMSSESQFPETR
jgi:hypothetical protein